MNARAGFRWYELGDLCSEHEQLTWERNRFNSDKVAEVSYASKLLAIAFRDSEAKL